MAGDHHLSDALTGFDGLGLIRKVDHDTFYLPAIIGINGAGRVEQSETAFGGKATTGSDLGFVADWEFNVKPSGYECSLQGFDRNGLGKAGPKVHSSAADSFVLGQRVGGFVDDFNSQDVCVLWRKSSRTCGMRIS